MVSHKPGAFKQPKKVHKHGKHKSKGALAGQQKGRVSVSKAGGGKGSLLVSKRNRMHNKSQIRKQKLLHTAELKKSLGGSGHPPICIAFIPANQDVKISPLLDSIRAQGDVTCDTPTSFYFYCKKLKKRFHMVAPSEQASMFEQLDLVKCCDVAVFVWDETHQMDQILRTCLFAQGLPSVQHVVTCRPVSTDRERVERRKQMTGVLEQNNLSPDSKVHYMDKPADLGALLWSLVSCKQVQLSFLKQRGYLISSTVGYEETSPGVGTLIVSGFVRGAGIDANQLIHLPGLGHHKVQKIVSAVDPARQKGMESENTVLSSPDSSCPGLEMECPVDEMDGEQTWPTEEEIEEAEIAAKSVKRVPKGTSSYQAVWMLSDDEYSDDEELVSNRDSEEGDSESGEEGEEFDAMSESVAPSEADDDVHFDEERELEDLAKFRDAVDNEQFPDEVDTPIDVVARTRFQKYRGMKSFRTSPWDPKENLPLDYARISQISNFSSVRKYLLKCERKSDRTVKVGSFVTLYIENVSSQITESGCSALTLYSLLPNEQKMTVLQVVLNRHPLSETLIKSKDQILAQVGCRRFLVKPIYSQHSKANKHKMERFMPTNGSFVASFYGPISLSQCPAILYKLEQDKTVTLLGSGSLMSCNPDRIVCKRIVLSGHPYKVHKHSASVRYLFHFREDINYFKPIEVRTKEGRRGHIREPLGTHGHCKVAFDGPIRQSDTVTLPLYKRAFPTWHFQYA